MAEQSAPSCGRKGHVFHHGCAACQRAAFMQVLIFLQVTRSMRETLRKQLIAVHQQSMAHGTKKDKWIKDNCFQLVITSSQITWWVTQTKQPRKCFVSVCPRLMGVWQMRNKSVFARNWHVANVLHYSSHALYESCGLPGRRRPKARFAA